MISFSKIMEWIYSQITGSISEGFKFLKSLFSSSNKTIQKSNISIKGDHNTLHVHTNTTETTNDNSGNTATGNNNTQHIDNSTHITYNHRQSPQVSQHGEGNRAYIAEHIHLTQLQVEDEKRKAKSLYNAAVEDIRYNGSRVGNSKVPFQINALRNLLTYDGPYQLSEEEKSELRLYIKTAGLCNGEQYGSMARPGIVQNQQNRWVEILEKHMRDLN